MGVEQIKKDDGLTHLEAGVQRMTVLTLDHHSGRRRMAHKLCKLLTLERGNVATVA